MRSLRLALLSGLHQIRFPGRHWQTSGHPSQNCLTFILMKFSIQRKRPVCLFSNFPRVDDKYNFSSLGIVKLNVNEYLEFPPPQDEEDALPSGIGQLPSGQNLDSIRLTLTVDRIGSRTQLFTPIQLFDTSIFVHIAHLMLCLIWTINRISF